MTTTSKLSCPPRFGTLRTPDRPTLGPQVAKVAEKLGKTLMPWQQHVLDVALEIDPITGELAYDEVGLTVPRQSGKSTLVLLKFVHRGMATGFFGKRQQMVYTAQTRKKALEKWREDYVAEIEASPLADRVIPHYPSGGEHLRFPNGSRFSVEANTEKAGHGSTLDEAYLDEAFAHTDGRLEQAFGPAMITRANTQLWVTSTAGWSDGSPYLQGKVRRGREQTEMGMRDGLAYFEWSAPDDAEPEDREVWARCMPALGRTITERKIAAVLAKHRDEGTLSDFRRAYLNQWVPKPREDLVETAAISPDAWLSLADPKAPRGSAPVFGVATAPDRSWSSVAVAWRRPDGSAQVMIGEDYRPDATWVAARVAELRKRWGGRVLVDSASKGLVPGALETSLADRAKADNGLADAVLAGTVRHGNEPALNTAVRASRWKNSGDTRVLDRKGDADISPLAAASLAVYGLTVVPPSTYENQGFTTL